MISCVISQIESKIFQIVITLFAARLMSNACFFTIQLLLSARTRILIELVPQVTKLSLLMVWALDYAGSCLMTTVFVGFGNI